MVEKDRYREREGDADGNEEKMPLQAGMKENRSKKILLILSWILKRIEKLN